MKKIWKKPVDRTGTERQRRYRARLRAAAETYEHIICDEAYMAKPRDYPFKEVVKEANRILATNPRVTIHQKFTCEKCGSRQGIMEENVFHKTGKCEQCGHVSNIEKNGCNYLIVARQMSPSELVNIMKGEKK